MHGERTHEEYLGEVARCAVAHAGPAHRDLLNRVKLVYGIGGDSNRRGVTAFGRWEFDGERLALVEVCAAGEEGCCQLAGTTIHELAHVLAGAGAGHGKAWKEACATLGLVRVEAAGTVYSPDSFTPALREVLEAIPTPSDGVPVWGMELPGGLVQTVQARPCTLGIGTRGGRSRGVGSGSRLLKAVCPVDGYTVRVTRMWADRGMPYCGCCQTRMVSGDNTET